jgi:nucleoside-triphosphatase THEP1
MVYEDILTKKTWYEELAYMQNPFSIKPIYSVEIRGRDDVAQKVKEVIKAKNMAVIHGTYGSGKTSFLKQIIDEFKGKRKVVYFSCNRIVDGLDVHKLLTERTLFSKLFNIKSKDMILLLDEADYLTDSDYKQILTQYKKGYIKSVLFITHNIKKFQAPQTILDEIGKNEFTFAKLSNYQIIQVVRDRVGETPLLPDDIVTKIYANSDSMRHFLKSCEQFMKYMVENKRKKATARDFKKAFTVSVQAVDEKIKVSKSKSE